MLRLFCVKMGYFGAFILELKPLPTKNPPSMLYAAEFQILSRL